MEKVLLILMVIYFGASCESKDSGDNRDSGMNKENISIGVNQLNSIELKDFILNYFGDNIDTLCGETETFKINIGHSSEKYEINTKLLLKCKYYDGDLVSKSGRQSNVFEQKVLLSDSILMDGVTYTYDEFAFVINKIINTEASSKSEVKILLIDSEQDSYLNTQKFLNSMLVNSQQINRNIQKRVLFVLEFKNELYYEDYNKNKPRATLDGSVPNGASQH